MSNKKQINGRDIDGPVSIRDEVVRPAVSVDAAVSLVARVYGLRVTNIDEKDGYCDRNFHVKVTDQWENPHIQQLCPDGYILKILNSYDSMHTQNCHFEAEHDMQQILLKNGLRCPKAVLNVHGDYKSLEKIDHRENNNNDVCSLHLVRLMEFIPGDVIQSVVYTPTLLHGVGEYIATMHTIWQDFQHPSLINFKHIWSMECVPSLRQLVGSIRNPTYRSYVNDIINSYEDLVIPNFKHFRKGVLHGDCNEQNIIVQPVERAPNSANDAAPAEHSVYGILDFGHAIESYYMCELFIVIAYLSIDSTLVDPLLVAGHILAGYTKHRELNNYEFDALKTGVAARLCQSLTIGEHKFSKDPQNEYILTTAKNGWRLLIRLWDTPKEELYAMWKNII